MSFTVKNCHVTVSFFFVAIMAVFLLEDQNTTALLGILAAALHELGHISMMCLLRDQPSKICFMPFGIDIMKSNCVKRSYQRDMLISLAGPGANLLAALVLYLFEAPTLSVFFYMNLAIAFFNLLPIEPLDGGQALYSALCIKLSADRSAKIVAILSFIVLTPLAVIGFLILFHSPGNFFLLLVCGYLMMLLLFKNGRYY